jgi:hypothetical protein
MLRTPAFGKGFGGTSVVLGALGAGGASLMIVDPASVLGPVFGLFTLIIFHFVLGWKVYRLSKGPVDSFGDRRKAVSFGDVNFEQQSARASGAARITELTEETK